MFTTFARRESRKRGWKIIRPLTSITNKTGKISHTSVAIPFSPSFGRQLPPPACQIGTGQRWFIGTALGSTLDVSPVAQLRDRLAPGTLKTTEDEALVIVDGTHQPHDLDRHAVAAGVLVLDLASV